MWARRSQPQFVRQWSPRIVPTFPIEVIDDHPLGRSGGLIFAVIPGAPSGFNDLCGNAANLAFTGGSITQGPLGPGYVYSGSGAAPVGNISPTTAQFPQGALVWRGRFTANQTGDSGILGVNLPSSPFVYWLMYARNANVVAFGYGTSSFQTTATLASFTTNTYFSLCARFMQASGVVMYKDGLQSGSSGLSGSFTTNTGTTVGFSGDTRATQCESTLGYIYRSALSDDLARWLDVEPFCMFRPVVRRRYFFSVPTSVVNVSGRALFSQIANTSARQTLAVKGRANISTEAKGVTRSTSAMRARATTSITAKVNVNRFGLISGRGFLTPTALASLTARSFVTAKASNLTLMGRATQSFASILFEGLVREILLSGGSAAFDAIGRELLAAAKTPVLFSGLVRNLLVSSPPPEAPIPVFPPLPQGFAVKMSPVMDTTIGTVKSLREMRVAQQTFPLWDFEILFEELLDQTQNQVLYAPFAGKTQQMQLMELWLMMYGQTGVFAFDCPWDDSRTDQQIAIGDGVTYVFTIYRTWGLGANATLASIGTINTVTNVKINGVTISTGHYRIVRNKIYFLDASNVAYPPGNGLAVTMTFSFYYLCRFVADEQDFEEFAKNRWTVPSLKFRAVNWP